MKEISISPRQLKHLIKTYNFYKQLGFTGEDFINWAFREDIIAREWEVFD